MRRVTMFLLCALLTICAPRRAFAYIDPGSGSILLQSILAGAVTAVLLLKAYWRRLTGWLWRRRHVGKAPSSEDGSERSS